MPDTEIRHVQVQTVSWCNRSCSFCPSGTFPAERKFMSLETYDRILDQLAATDFAGRFSPYCMNEPLLDRRLPTLVAHARSRLPRARMLLQTNGDALKPELGAKLLEAGINRLIVNVYDVEKLVPFRAMAREIAEGTPGARKVGYLGRGRLTTRARQIQVRDCTVYDASNLTNRAGNVDGSGLVEPLKLSCDRPFNHLTIRYDGDVVLCPCDWKAEVVLGNLVDNTLEEVWSGAAVQAYRRNLSEKNRNMKLCDVCDYRGSQLRDFRPVLKLKQIASDLAGGRRGARTAPNRDRRLPVVPDRRAARVRARPLGAGISDRG